MSGFIKSLGAAMFQARQETGLTLHEASVISGIDKGTLSDMERSAVTHPDHTKEARRLADGVSLSGAEKQGVFRLISIVANQ